MRGTSTHIFRCRSPTMRALRMLNTPSKHGSGNACPQGPPARSACAVSSAISCERRARHRSRWRRPPVRLRSPARDLLVEGAREGIELRALERQARGHGVAAEAADELGMARGDGVEHVADVDAGDRARRAAQLPSPAQREGDHRPAQPVLDAARDQADDALVPARIEQAHAAALERPRARIAQAAHRGRAPPAACAPRSRGAPG